jgi:endonuclease-8
VLFNAQIAEFHTARSLARSSQVPKLGPDILSGEFTVEHGIAAMRARIQSHPDDEAGVMLLNQRVMAGLGNVYKSEVAFAAGVNPFRQINTLTDREIDVMAEFALKWMKANVHDGQQRGEAGEGIVTYTGPRRTTHAMDRSDRTFVYGRQGMECRRCGAIIERRLQGVAARPTYWCPGCQPWVASAGQSEAPPVGRKVKLVGKRRKIGC